MIPPGGWAFLQAVEGSSAFKIDGQTYGQLESKVFEFRLANIEIIPSGTATRESVRDDIRDFICSQYPQQCTGSFRREKEANTQPVNGTVEYRTPISRLDDWFKTLAFSTLEWGDAATAIARAETCATCPQNIAWQTNCAPCVGNVQRRVARYKGDKATALDSKLKACRCFGFHTEIAVWLKNALSQPKETPPDACWNK